MLSSLRHIQRQKWLVSIALILLVSVVFHWQQRVGTHFERRVLSSLFFSVSTANRQMDTSQGRALTEVTKCNDSKVKVIILTYMRSGSTFTGDLFNHHPDVFYLYEPLWMLDFHFNKREPLKYLRSDPVHFNSSDAFQKTSVQNDVMLASLSCKFYDLPIQTLKMDWIPAKSTSCRPYNDCVRYRSGNQRFLACLPLLKKACTSANVTVAKTVRMSMQQAAILLNVDPEVKVIHLVRDPRGQARSMQYSTRSLRRLTLARIQTFCSRVLRDLEDSQELKRQHPGRILTARYEDLAKSPLTFAARLMDFSCLQMDRRLQNYVMSITSAKGDVREMLYNTKRKDSDATANRWRLEYDVEYVSMIDDVCRGVYGHMGYLPLSDGKTLRNLNVSSCKNLEEVPGLWSF